MIPVKQAIDLIAYDLNKYLAADTKNIFSFYASHCLFETMALRDPRTASHSFKVGIYAYLLASRMDPNHSIEYFIGGLVHDMGKIAFPDFILKGKKLYGKALEQIQEHVQNSVSILVTLEMPKIIINFAKYHHERHNGSGYPSAARGNEIPIEGSIAAVADVYSAMTEQNRGYQLGKTHKEAIQILRGLQDQFDPTVLKVFFEMFDDVKTIDYVNQIESLLSEKVFSFEKIIKSLRTVQISVS